MAFTVLHTNTIFTNPLYDMTEYTIISTLIRPNGSMVKVVSGDTIPEGIQRMSQVTEVYPGQKISKRGPELGEAVKLAKKLCQGN